MINSDNRTDWSPILSEIILVINKSDISRYDVVNQSYDYRSNCTPLSLVTIINQERFE